MMVTSVSGVIHLLKTGGRCRYWPREYGPHTAISIASIDGRGALWRPIELTPAELTRRTTPKSARRSGKLCEYIELLRKREPAISAGAENDRGRPRSAYNADDRSASVVGRRWPWPIC